MVAAPRASLSSDNSYYDLRHTVYCFIFSSDDNGGPTDQAPPVVCPLIQVTPFLWFLRGDVVWAGQTRTQMWRYAEVHMILLTMFYLQAFYYWDICEKVLLWIWNAMSMSIPHKIRKMYVNAVSMFMCTCWMSWLFLCHLNMWATLDPKVAHIDNIGLGRWLNENLNGHNIFAM